MKRPSFQFYPADWRLNAKLQRCSPAARGVWMDLLCLLHDSDEYGALRWPLADIINAVRACPEHVHELVNKGVLKGSDNGLTEPYIYIAVSGRRQSRPVTLLERCGGPVWYCSRMVCDEYVRQQRGKSGRFSAAKPATGTTTCRNTDGGTGSYRRRDTAEKTVPSQAAVVPDASPKGDLGERQGDGSTTTSTPSSTSSSTFTSPSASSPSSPSSSPYCCRAETERQHPAATISMPYAPVVRREAGGANATEAAVCLIENEIEDEAVFAVANGTAAETDPGRGEKRNAPPVAVSPPLACDGNTSHPELPAAPALAARITGYGIPLLVSQGLTQAAAQMFFAEALRRYGDDPLTHVLEQCVRKQPLCALGWISAMLAAEDASGRHAGRRTRS